MKKILLLSLLNVLLLQCLNLRAQEPIPSFTVEDSLGVTYNLPDIFEYDTKYILVVAAHWCNYCKLELIAWRDCAEEWLEKYNLKIIVLATDLIIPDQVWYWSSYYENPDYKYSMYFAHLDTIKQHLTQYGFPMNHIIDENKNLIELVPGYKTCNKMDSLLNIIYTPEVPLNSNPILSDIDYQFQLFGNNYMIKMKETVEIVVEMYSIDGRLLEQKKALTNTNFNLTSLRGVSILRILRNNELIGNEIIHTD